MSTSKVGVISDTHGLLRPEALRALQGSELILHAGDVGKPEILDALREICPVTAVRGNIDKGRWAEALPETARIAMGMNVIYMLHDVNELDFDPRVAGVHVVISGHSHKAVRHESGGVVYLNPGSAGPRRFHLPVTLARLDLRRSPIEIDFLSLLDEPVPGTR